MVGGGLKSGLMGAADPRPPHWGDPTSLKEPFGADRRKCLFMCLRFDCDSLGVCCSGESEYWCMQMSSICGFESGSRLELIEESDFSWSGLKWSFYACKSLESVVFENGSRLEWIEEFAFFESGLESIAMSPSATFIELSAFHGTPVRFGL
jgi:hypothetical protein